MVNMVVKNTDNNGVHFPGEKLSCQAHIVHIYVSMYACIPVHQYIYTKLHRSCVFSDREEFGCMWSNFLLGLLYT